MLFINNPEARTTIIEQSRRDNGLVLATDTDVTPGAPTESPSRARNRLAYRMRPVATS